MTLRHSHLIAVLFTLVLGTIGCEKEPKLDSDEKKAFYALGVMAARNMESFDLTKSDLDMITLGLQDKLIKKKTQIEPQEYFGKLREIEKERSSKKAAGEITASAKFVADAAKTPGAKKMKSGLVYIELTPGKGKSPTATDRVKVHYKGTLRDGTTFDSSYDRKEPATFPINGVIPCWTEALQLMKVGGKSKIFCPHDIAYGAQGRPPKIKGGAALAFEVELLEILKPEKHPKMPFGH